MTFLGLFAFVILPLSIGAFGATVAHFYGRGEDSIPLDEP